MDKIGKNQTCLTASQLHKAEQPEISKDYEMSYDCKDHDKTYIGRYVEITPLSPIEVSEDWVLEKLAQYTPPTIDTSFKKQDDGKAPLAHLRYIPNSLAEVARVLHYGAEVKGYGRINWKKCDDLDRYYSAADRHITAFYNGELKDPESGFSHLAHAISNLLFINEIMETRGKEKQTNDKEEKSTETSSKAPDQISKEFPLWF